MSSNPVTVNMAATRLRDRRSCSAASRGAYCEQHHVSVFKDSKILHVDRFSDLGPDPDAPVVFIEFQINGQPFQAINCGSEFAFSEAVSFSIACANQDEVDYYWDTLTQGGEPGPCGWLKDKYGVSWQVVPTALIELLRDADRERAGQVMRRMLQMSKLDVAELEAAYERGDGK
jgi:predicted 3-demethylubiquinone-9 3-methyltransferase (glyoxalase superfamily)